MGKQRHDIGVQKRLRPPDHDHKSRADKKTERSKRIAKRLRRWWEENTDRKPIG